MNKSKTIKQTESPKLNPICVACIQDCKQAEFVVIVKCPNQKTPEPKC